MKNAFIKQKIHLHQHLNSIKLPLWPVTATPHLGSCNYAAAHTPFKIIRACAWHLGGNIAVQQPYNATLAPKATSAGPSMNICRRLFACCQKPSTCSILPTLHVSVSSTAVAAQRSIPAFHSAPLQGTLKHDTAHAAALAESL